MTARKAGYSLFEVLIAFTVMSLVLAAIIPGQAKFIRRNDMLIDGNLAYDFALSQLAKLGISEPINPGEKHWEYRDWIVSESITENRVSPLGAPIFYINISVKTPNNKTIARIQTIRVYSRE